MRSRMFLVIAIEGARKATVEDDELYLEFAPEAKHLRDNLAKPESVKLLREVCREVMGRDIGVRIVIKEKGESESGEPASKQEAERALRNSVSARSPNTTPSSSKSSAPFAARSLM